MTREDYHITFGLHSGYPLCCVMAFVDANHSSHGGPCQRCRDKGIENWPLHVCRPGGPGCDAYLDLVEENSVEILQNFLEGTLRVVDEDVNASTFVTQGSRILSDTRREMLKEAGYLMTHICWSTVMRVDHYKYIFQHFTDKEVGKCARCKRKYSLNFPTTGSKFLAT